VPAATVAVDASEVGADDASDASSLEVVEIPFDDVPVGDAPDIEARVKYTADLQKRGITELEAKAIENNQKIKQYNNAPEEFPTFVREGYDVRVLTTDGFVTQDDGLVFKDFVTGEGDLPRDGQEVTFQYVAYNESGGTIDSTYRKGVPASTRLGINGMIPGFEEGLKGMRPGGKRRVVVPPELGPPTGPATFFSAKQWEVFDIELLEVKNCARVQSSFMSSSVVCE
jgi:FKBP-type peptidyl-prolyl cis-trans isomerase